MVESSQAYIIRTTSLHHSSVKCFQEHVRLPGILQQSVFDFQHERDAALPYQYDRTQNTRSTFHELCFEAMLDQWKTVTFDKKIILLYGIVGGNIYSGNVL